MNFAVQSLILLLACMSATEKVQAGILLSSGAKWSVFSLEPEKEEPTPNYQGMTGELKFGYSFRQIFDLAANVQYTPGHVGMVKVPGEGANLIFYGGEIAARIRESVYFAFRGGTGSYQLLMRTLDDEVGGRWKGPAGGISIGGIVPFGKTDFFQISFDFLQMITSKQDAEGESGKRRVDQFSIGVSYIFNGRHNSAIENSFFSHYLNSFLFWE